MHPTEIPHDPPRKARIVGAIPARYGSERLPGKALADIGGRPLVEHVYRRAAQAGALTGVVVLTDDRRIADAVAGFGGAVEMTPGDCASGTDRIAWAVRNWDVDAVVNIPGDEPLIDPALIDELAQALIDDPALHMVTAANPLEPTDPAVTDPNVVKTVLKANGHALYFSRSPLPYFRNEIPGLQALRHKGIYGYRRDFLETFVTWPPSPLEQAESLEQLRALENGASIRVLTTTDTSPGVDTPEQAEEIERILSTSAN